MGYQPLPQKQLFTVGQIVAAISIAACLVFIVSYSGRIIMDKKVRAKQEQMQQAVEEASAFSTTIQGMIDNVDSLEVVEPYARIERNMGQDGEQAVAPQFMAEDQPASAQQEIAVETQTHDAGSIPNWRLWWDFVITGGAQQ